MDEIKLVDLRKENLNTVKEAIKLASSMGAAGFKLYINPNFIKTGLVSTRIVPVSGEIAPKTQLLLNFAGLKNLKNTIEFAKKILGDAGEIDVKEVETPALAVAPTPAPVEVPALVVEDVTAEPEEELLETAEELTSQEDEELAPETKTSQVELDIPKASKKRSRKKTTILDEADIAEIADPEEGAE